MKVYNIIENPLNAEENFNSVRLIKFHYYYYNGEIVDYLILPYLKLRVIYGINSTKLNTHLKKNKKKTLDYTRQR